jgi:hypothetical protein
VHYHDNYRYVAPKVPTKFSHCADTTTEISVPSDSLLYSSCVETGETKPTHRNGVALREEDTRSTHVYLDTMEDKAGLSSWGYELQEQTEQEILNKKTPQSSLYIMAVDDEALP